MTFLYLFFFLFILRKFKECFSLGEAGIACQALTILLNSLVVNVIDFFKHDKHFSNSMQISTIIIQVCSCRIVFFYFYSRKYFLDRTFGDWYNCWNSQFIQHTENSIFLYCVNSYNIFNNLIASACVIEKKSTSMDM